MNERHGLATVHGIEAALDDLRLALEVPPTPDLATAVAARLRAEPVVLRRPRPGLRRLRRGLLLAAVISLLVVGTVLGIRFGLRSLGIEFGTVPTPSVAPLPSTSPGTTPSATPTPRVELRLGTPVSLDEAQATVPFAVLVPSLVPPPDAVFVGGQDLRGQLAFVYEAGADLPASGLLGGAGLLVTQNHGTTDDGLAHKLVDSGLATVSAVTVDGAAGYWISGSPHAYWYLAPDGTAIEGSRRLVGDTLVWERDGVLYRIEGVIAKERALEIAESMTAPTP